MNKYFIGFLISILIIIYFLIRYENENFQTLTSQTNLITDVLNVKHAIIGGNDNKVFLINFPSLVVPATIYTNFDDVTQQTYYYIYNKGKIMILHENKLYFNQSGVESIMSPDYSNKYKLYKTLENNLYYLIGDTKMYLSASKKDFIIEVEITTDPKKALVWEL